MKRTNFLALVLFPTASLAFAPQLVRKTKSLSTVSSQSNLAIASNQNDYDDESFVQDPVRRMALIALPASLLLGISEEDEVEASEQILCHNIESSSQIVAPVEVTPLPGVGFGGMGFGPFGFSPFGGFGKNIITTCCSLLNDKRQFAY